ncbi:MAG: hypothetical protein A7316_08435 [Candidatus Altiarchaeales archaeon WOR_SM1_86-2]|nr:MAG: hypothetical protein A7316_08435 [Candidatus Altiarchaeales archaeon WOR_SM1_86-2]
MENKKMSLSEKNKNILMIELNRIIEETAERTARSVIDGTIIEGMAYPPNNGFTETEKKALLKIQSIENIESTLRKILADAASYPLFGLFCLIDGVSDPETENWDGITLVDRGDKIVESEFMLHDELYETYWDWRKIRKNKGWKLDILDD